MSAAPGDSDAGIPRSLAALLFEFNDEQTHSARYVRTWPPESTDAPITAARWEQEMTAFYKRHGEGDIRLGYDSKCPPFPPSSLARDRQTEGWMCRKRRSIAAQTHPHAEREREIGWRVRACLSSLS